MAVRLTVVGSINLDLVARVERLPRAGETVVGHDFDRVPGGKGANQAVAAARLGAHVRMVGAVGDDSLADEALVGLRDAGVDLELARTGTTGIALILVDDAGENQIVVVPGANGEVSGFSSPGSVLCQLEIPDAALQEARANRAKMDEVLSTVRASTSSPDAAQQALEQARAANQTAQEAKAMAQQAQDATQRSSARADRMFQKSMRK